MQRIPQKPKAAASVDKKVDASETSPVPETAPVPPVATMYNVAELVAAKTVKESNSAPSMAEEDGEPKAALKAKDVVPLSAYVTQENSKPVASDPTAKDEPVAKAVEVMTDQ